MASFIAVQPALHQPADRNHRMPRILLPLQICIARDHASPLACRGNVPPMQIEDTLPATAARPAPVDPAVTAEGTAVSHAAKEPAADLPARPNNPGRLSQSEYPSRHGGDTADRGRTAGEHPSFAGDPAAGEPAERYARSRWSRMQSRCAVMPASARKRCLRRIEAR